MRCFSALPLLVGGGVQHLLLFQQGGDLARPFSLHAEREDPLHDLCSFLVNHPFLGVARVMLVAVGNVGGQALSALTLCLVDGTDFTTGILGIPLISQPRIKNDGLCFDISDKIVVDVNVAFFVIVHGIAFTDLNFLNQAHQRGTV